MISLNHGLICIETQPRLRIVPYGLHDHYALFDGEKEVFNGTYGECMRKKEELIQQFINIGKI